MPAGQPAATESPGDAPASKNVDSAQPPAAMLVKSITAADARYVGTVAESTATTDCDPVSSVTIPAPLVTFRVLRNARRSVPPLASHVPFVAVHVYSGIDPVGKELIPPTAAQTPAHAAVKLCPAVKAPDGSTYRYTVPVPAERVIVLLFVTEYTVLPSRTLQGVAFEQFSPAVSTVGLVSTSPTSPNCEVIPAPLPCLPARSSLALIP